MQQGKELTLKQQILVRAAELIGIRDSWIKGSCWDGGDKYCMLGALCKAAAEEGLRIKPYISDGLVEAIAAVSNHVPGPNPETRTDFAALGYAAKAKITHYNDRRVTSHKDVKAIFCETLKDELSDDREKATSETTTPVDLA